MGILSRLLGKTKPINPPAFDLAQSMLYQPDEVLRARIPDVNSLGGYLKQIHEVGTDYWASLPRSEGQALTIVVAIRPGGRARFWLESSPDGVGAVALDPFEERLRRLPVPCVQEGPVGLALHANLWGGQEGGWVFIPAEWQAHCAGQQLVIPDDVLEIVWPDNHA